LRRWPPSRDCASCSFLRAAHIILQLLSLPALQGLQTLRVFTSPPESALQLLPALPALHTLECRRWDEPADWRWLPAMPALTDLDLSDADFLCLPQSAFDTIGQCVQLQSLRLRSPNFSARFFARLCLTPALRRLRHLDIDRWNAAAAVGDADHWRTAFSALAQLESLRLAGINGVDLLLPHLAHAPALLTLIIVCTPDHPFSIPLYGPTHPSRLELRRLLTAAPRLEVRLQMATSIDQWRALGAHRKGSAPDHEQMDEQWREFQRMAAQLERVTIVGFDD